MELFVDGWLGAVAVLVGVAAGVLAYRRARREARRKRRRVEKPNSHYASPGVRQQADIERWERIAVDELHPVNRDEVDRLLALARDDGPETLSRRERQFLDNLAPS